MTDTGVVPAVGFEKARPRDAEALTQVSVRSFDDDSRRYGGLPRGGPPGYDVPEWHRWAMRRGIYFKILAGDVIVGGIILFDLRRRHFNLGCFFVDPDHQGQGIGTRAVAFVEAAHPHVKKWSLDTPAWSPRNHHFYEKLGYVRTGEEWTDEAGVRLWAYEKHVQPRP
ncbi:MAG: N-acetyltransferase [Chloroflexi bacterium]|nr:MAG: N-acetyltransferase [Chloroflexota bacterium]